MVKRKFFIIERISKINEKKQECIPVGCVPPALYYMGALLDRHLLKRDPLDRDLPQQKHPGQRPPVNTPPL